MKRYFKTAFSTLLALLLLFSLLEAVLRTVFPDIGGAADVPLEHSAVRIESRTPNTQKYSFHPELRQLHAVRYNNFGMAHTPDVDSRTLASIPAVGLFGDGRVENFHLEQPYTVGRLLECLLHASGSKARVLNFGVEGYGPDQAFLYYRHSPLAKHLDFVFYFLAADDLVDIRRNDLFYLASDGSLEQRPLPAPSHVLQVLSRLHVSYLALALWNHLNPEHKINTGENFYNRLVAVELSHQSAKRTAAEPVRAIVEDLLNGESGLDTEDSKLLLRRILETWRSMAAANSATFTAVSLPTTQADGVADELPDDLPVLPLLKRFEAEIEGFDWQQISFAAGRLWNERGNELAAAALLRFLEEPLNLTPLPEEAIETELRRCRGVPAPGAE